MGLQGHVALVRPVGMEEEASALTVSSLHSSQERVEVWPEANQLKSSAVPNISNHKADCLIPQQMSKTGTGVVKQCLAMSSDQEA